jgi:C1A family cysteine protease
MALPAKVDLRKWASPVQDQGSLGSCTANAIASALEMLQIKYEGKTVAAVMDYSRLFIYYNERKMEGTISEDAGAYIRDGIKSLNSFGACNEALWPYNISQFKKRPPAAAYTEAKKHLFKSYERLPTLNSYLTCLAQGFPFVFGFAVYESFESATVARTGNVPMPKTNEQMLGGHAVLCVGYDQSTKRFIVQNSWGTDWGKKGFFTIPFDYLASKELADDFWVVRTPASAGK